MKTTYFFGQDIISERETAIDKTACLWVTKTDSCGDFFYANNLGVPIKVVYAPDQKALAQNVTGNIFKLTSITVKVKGFEKDCVPVAELVEVGETVQDCPI